MDLDWNHGYSNKYGKFIEYEKAWYCNQNKIIHISHKEFRNCKYCNYERDTK